MNAFYEAGAAARAKNIHKNNNPHAYMTSRWAWWLAGWNDTDMELRDE